MTSVLLPTLLYLLAVELCALAVWPLSWRVFAVLPERGYTASKVLGPLLLTYVIWLTGMLGWLELERGTLLVLLALTAVVCWRRYGEEALSWARMERGT